MKWHHSTIIITLLTLAGTMLIAPLDMAASGDVEESLALSIKKDIIEAVVFAASLDERLWEKEGQFNSKQEVFEHYKQGFTDNLAEMFTEYWWWDMKGKLLPGDPLLAPPEEVVVGKFSDDKAEAYYKTPEVLRDPDTWGLEPFIYVELERQEDRWIVVKAMNKDKQPF
jgi:hypothetical protein